MSKINTNGIDANYPIPGQNNSSQGFRDNFSQIKNNLNIAGGEITNLESKVLLKSALNGGGLNNEMANALISGAATKNFRSTTYNLGGNLSGRVVIDTSIADVHYGTVAANTTLQFTKWAPTDTERSIKLQLTFANTDARIQLPCEGMVDNNYGLTLLENSKVSNNIVTISKPADSDIVDLEISTLNCGNTITVTPTNRPFKATQIVVRDVSPTGLPGDVLGTIAVDANYLYVCTSDFDSEVYPKTVTATTATGNVISLENTTNLVVNIPVIFTGNVDTANTNIVENQWYYVKTVDNGNITISASRTSGVADSEFSVGTATLANTSATFYVGSDIWKRVDLSTW